MTQGDDRRGIHGSQAGELLDRLQPNVLWFLWSELANPVSDLPRSRHRLANLLSPELQDGLAERPANAEHRPALPR